MKLINASLIILFLSASSWAGPILVGGAGESEYSVVFAQANFKQIIDECVNYTCSLSDNDRIVLTEFTKQPIPQIYFKRSAELGTQLFRLVEGEAWVNQDELWLDDLKTVSYGVGDGAALVLQILSEQVQTPVSKAILKKVLDSQKGMSRSLGLRDQYESLFWSRPEGSDYLYIRDSVLTSIALTPEVAKILPCGQDEVKIKFYAPAWIADNRALLIRTVTLGFGIRWKCGKKSGNSSGIAAIEAKSATQDITTFDPKTLFIQIER